ncbi:MAG: hypothetical protein HYR77_03220 [Ignavibacteria bacterium]|nr:hypothetical protein [Ignavibacteria bacterium]
MNFSSCKFATLIIVVPLLNLALDCHDAGTEPPVDTNRVKLTMIDAGVREAYLSLTVAQPPAAETIRYDIR